ncbi:hypothetical protein [Pararhizobium haloflavum]|uniref:hypothetical protein n=1 Tax=Pararhizobium haloflavum TaxID=2037914 RepID=UPI0012FFEEE3|nr:hypothetical protein [Pararhizobium haloflavum]
MKSARKSLAFWRWILFGAAIVASLAGHDGKFFLTLGWVCCVGEIVLRGVDDKAGTQ